MRATPADGRPSRWAWAVPLVALGLALVATIADPQALRGLRNATFDQFQRWHPRPFTDAAVRIVDIDDESLRRVGQWPWSRERIAELTAAIESSQPAAVAMDIVFPEPDRTSTPTRAGASTVGDDALARTLAQSNVALGFAVKGGTADGVDARPGDVLRVKPTYLSTGGDPLPFLQRYVTAVASLPVLQDAAAGQGAMTFEPDDDGVVRRVPLVMNLDGRLVPSLAAEALRLAGRAGGYVVHSAGDDGGIVDVRIGARTLETNAAGALWVHFSPPRAQRYVPAWQVLAHQLPADALRGRVVFVGTSAQGLMDLRFSPRGGIIPGVEVHAQALEQVLAGDGLSRPGWAPAVELIALLLGGLVVAVVAMTRAATVSTAVAVALAAALGGAAWFAFVRGHVLLDPSVPMGGLALVFVPTTLLRHFLAERQQRFVRDAFSRYVSPNLVDYLIAHPEALALGGKRQRCSFVFADLAGFTSLMETMDPAAAVSVLNGYLDRMIAIAFEHDGTLDRIVGDAVAIVFSTPVEQVDHERRALRCALQMHAFARRYVDDLAAQGVAFCETRIGVHTGEVTVGNFGGGAIFDYRALGDPVNTAARLEGANKHLGTLICVSEATLAACPDAPARPIGRLRLAGRSGYVMAYEPLQDGAPGAACDPDYADAFERLRAGRPEAVEAFEALAAARPADPLVKLHATRLRAGQRDDAIELSGK